MRRCCHDSTVIIVSAIVIFSLGAMGTQFAQRASAASPGYIDVLNATSVSKASGSSFEPQAWLNDNCAASAGHSASQVDFGSVPMFEPYSLSGPARLSVMVRYVSTNLSDFPVKWNIPGADAQVAGFATEWGSMSNLSAPSPEGTYCASQEATFSPGAASASELAGGPRTFQMTATSPSGQILGSITLTGNATAPDPSTCVKTVTIDSADSNTRPLSATGGAFGTALSKLFFGRIGEMSFDGVDSPTAPATDGSQAYRTAVANGEASLRGKIAVAVAACPSTKIFLTGLGEGADVAASVYQHLPPTTRIHIAGVALFGDPYFNPADSTSDRGTFATTRHGLLGTRGQFHSNRVLSYCQAKDPICQGTSLPWLAGAHRSYVRLGYPTQAAKALANN